MKTLVKFKSMAEILLSEMGAKFDHYGNLHCAGDHLAPTYFGYLGQLKEMNAGHSFPAWAIEKEYRDDALPSNVPLRILRENLGKELTEFQSEGLKEIVEKALQGRVTLAYRCGQ